MLGQSARCHQVVPCIMSSVRLNLLEDIWQSSLNSYTQLTTQLLLCWGGQRFSNYTVLLVCHSCDLSLRSNVKTGFRRAQSCGGSSEIKFHLVAWILCYKNVHCFHNYERKYETGGVHVGGYKTCLSDQTNSPIYSVENNNHLPWRRRQKLPVRCR